MSLSWLLKALVGSQKTTGLFSYLAGRDHNRSRIELERARQAATANLLDHLPRGAVFRESTADGWREVWIPPLPTAPLFIVPTDGCDQLYGRGTFEDRLQNPEAIESKESPPAST
jgi:hypothetical protein